MTDTLIKVDRVSKKFCSNLKRSLWYGVKDLYSELLPKRATDKNKLRPYEFWAVDDISFEIKRGECLGLIGRNGAGKTTLLRMLNGLIKPDRGRIEMKGKIGAVIALGSGFNPVLTGRENIYINGTVLGLNKKTIDEHLEEIIAFAELDEFIDMPVQSYSSGMRVRLGFAVATIFDPDILILDEVLAVGDASFRNKCYHRIAKIRQKAAVIFVSHNMEQIARTATTCILLKKGKEVCQGSVPKCVAEYNKLNQTTAQMDGSNFLSIYPPVAQFEAIFPETKIMSGQHLVFNVMIACDKEIKNPLFKIIFYNTAGAFSADGTVFLEQEHIRIQEGVNNLLVSSPFVPLKNGKYFIALNLIDEIGDLIVWSYKNHQIEVWNSYAGAIADCQIKLKIQKNKFDNKTEKRLL